MERLEAFEARNRLLYTPMIALYKEYGLLE